MRTTHSTNIEKLPVWTEGNRLYLRANRDIKAHEQIFIHYGVNYWADDSFALILMIQAV